MLFNSFVFAGLFLPLTLLAFWLAPKDGHKRAVLLATSLFYYAYWYWPYLALMAGLVGVAWACGLAAQRHRSALPVWTAAIVLLGILAFFKYAGFLVTVGQDVGWLEPGSRRIHSLALPIGISFIVFQALGYVVDVHRGEYPAERRYSVVLLFKAFFPQLIAGPICRAHELIPQLTGRFTFRASQVAGGVGIFAVGLLLKEVFADGLAPLVDKLYAGSGQGMARVDAWAAAIGFGAQIYADFWGYSTMAVGLARMFGVEIPVNFRLPYLATSLREFWRRWHITLSQWLRDYLYKPLGGSRKGAARTVAALMATMVLGGIWHGANYTFVVWGALHGAALVVEHLLLRSRPGERRGAVSSALGWVYTFVVVFIAWVFFRAGTVEQGWHIVRSMAVGAPAAVIGSEARQIAALSFALLVFQLPLERLLELLRGERIAPAWALGLSFWATLGAVVLGAPAAVPFIYFQF